LVVGVAWMVSQILLKQPYTAKASASIEQSANVSLCKHNHGFTNFDQMHTLDTHIPEILCLHKICTKLQLQEDISLTQTLITNTKCKGQKGDYRNCKNDTKMSAKL